MTINNDSARRKAELAGAKTYTSENPCARGHTGPRRTQCGSCFECRRENQSTYLSKRLAEAESADIEFANDVSDRARDIGRKIIPGARVFLMGREVSNERR